MNCCNVTPRRHYAADGKIAVAENIRQHGAFIAADKAALLPCLKKLA